MTRVLFMLLFGLSGAFLIQESYPPEGFVYLEEVAPTIKTEVRYFSSDNFMGRKVEGYDAAVIILTREAAQALKSAQAEFLKRNLSLKVFDAYRPQMAVSDFVAWARDLNDTVNKSEYYPNILKSQLFDKGYIAEYSGHSRGSTVDVTLVDLETNEELDMGTPFDFFSPRSWPHSNLVTRQQKQNRILLRGIMMQHGFEPLETEWWHFTLKDEPFPDTYFNFPVR